MGDIAYIGSLQSRNIWLVPYSLCNTIHNKKHFNSVSLFCQEINTENNGTVNRSNWLEELPNTEMLDGTSHDGVRKPTQLFSKYPELE